MPKIVSDAERARPVSLSLTAEEIFILEQLENQKWIEDKDAPDVYRSLIKEAGSKAGIAAYTLNDQGETVATDEFTNFLKRKNWNGEKSKPKHPRRYRATNGFSGQNTR